MPPDIHAAALALWNYHRLGHTLSPADGILVFGSNDLRVASHAAALFHAEFAPWILFSGARGRMTEDWLETEAKAMAAFNLLVDAGFVSQLRGAEGSARLTNRSE